MTVSVKGEYALLALLDLAQQPAGIPTRIADIAARQKIPQKFLELILATLKQGAFVESRRGAEGGYLLARPARSITVGEVVRFLDGERKRPRGEAPFEPVWREVDAAVAEVVDRTSIEDVSRAWLERQSRYVPNWEI
jgi:Rrf2 family protein